MVYDTIIIGGGIVGLATALQLQQRNPGHRLLVLEKAADLACHQTGHNSGVIHSGIYYQPGSYKARFCQAGNRATVAYCRDHDIAHRITGKLIVATSEAEQARLKQLLALSGEHGLKVEWLSAAALREVEPNVAGRAALRVFATGIVDFVALAKSFAEKFRSLGGHIRCAAPVLELVETPADIRVQTPHAEYQSTSLVACCGLQADRVAAMLDVEPGCRIVPIRGEYFRLAERATPWVSLPIYPVPQPGVPFLGVHITPMIDGGFTVGPNAVLGWAREGYRRRDFSLRDTWDSLSYAGFWRMAARNRRHAWEEMKDSVFTRGYLRQVQKYCPDVSRGDLLPYPAGIRAQAVNRQGQLLHDFHFAQTKRSLHVCNAPSPAATSAIPIGAYLCDKLARLCGDTN